MGDQARAEARVTSYVVGASYSALTQNQYTAIAFNAYQVQRCLVVGPAGESGQQRYLLHLAHGAALQGTWRSRRRTPRRPSTRSGTKAGNRRSLRPLRYGVRCLLPTSSPSGTQRRLTTGPTRPACWSRESSSRNTRSRWQTTARPTRRGSTSARRQTRSSSAPNSGTVQSSSLPGFATGILAGRLIVVRRGPSAAAAYEVQRFFLYADVNLTVQ